MPLAAEFGSTFTDDLLVDSYLVFKGTRPVLKGTKTIVKHQFDVFQRVKNGAAKRKEKMCKRLHKR